MKEFADLLSGAPRSIRVAVIAQAVALMYGGIVHLVQVAVGGWPPYRWAPAWLAIYFTSLTVFDPLAAGLLAQRLMIGLNLTAYVLVGQGFSILPGDVPQTRGLPHVRARSPTPRAEHREDHGPGTSRTPGPAPNRRRS
jgi:hypothetical protein